MESSILRSRQGLGAFVTGLLEIVASERPDLLGPLIEALEHSPAGRRLAQIAEMWGVRPEDRTEDLGHLAVRASKHHDRLEKYRTGWRHPNQMVDEPNVRALLSFVFERRKRVPGIGQGQAAGCPQAQAQAGRRCRTPAPGARRVLTGAVGTDGSGGIHGLAR